MLSGIDTTGQKITNLGTPTVGTDAVTKAYADTVASTYAEATMTGWPAQTLNHVVFTTIAMNVKVTDAAGAYNTTTYTYTTPSTGIYFCRGQIRSVDSQISTTTEPNLGIGIHSSNIDGSWFWWHKMQRTSGSGIGGRETFTYVRIAEFPAGSPLRMYAYLDGVTTHGLASAAMQIYRLA